ncbi:MAG: DUF262 domain-containing protein [Bacteroidales bacterium]|nr:DUF262 domain-containing protein [Bacteroidales bacterium]
MGNIILQTINISKIDGNFFVPAYQRGYRWGKEAIKLLDDISEIDEKSDYKYCLQPIVIKKKEDGSFQLIDGQQRLTTIFLIFNVIKKYVPFAEVKFNLSFEVRERSEQYLNTINENSSEENIDFYFIKKSYMAIKKWFEDQNDPSLISFNFYKKLSERIDVIWYEVDSQEDGNSLFQRLNIGKIPLTSSELVKAIFLSESSKNTIQNRQEEISLQWDTIEKELHDSSLWYFLTNNTKSTYQTRIDLILNLISKTQDSNDKYATFFYFDNLRKTTKLLDIWNDIQHTFLILKDWYHNHDLYHRIGFLITVGVKIGDIYNLSIGKTKSDFNKLLIDRIKESVKINKSYGELSYDNQTDYRNISKLLLLFNVESTRLHGEESQWFPFDKYKSNKWSLEHIHAQQSEGMKTIAAWKDWLKLHQNSLNTVGQIQVDVGNISADELKDIKNQVTNMLSDTYPTEGYGEKFKEIREMIVKLLSEGMNVKYLHSISNLALLNTQDNAALNNSTFDVKRNQIIKMIKNGKFVPYCTQMVFLKYYTASDVNQVHFWGQADRDSYIKELNNILREYINPIVIFNEEE